MASLPLLTCKVHLHEVIDRTFVSIRISRVIGWTYCPIFMAPWFSLQEAIHDILRTLYGYVDLCTRIHSNPFLCAPAIDQMKLNSKLPWWTSWSLCNYRSNFTGYRWSSNRCLFDLPIWFWSAAVKEHFRIPFFDLRSVACDLFEACDCMGIFREHRIDPNEP